MTPKLNDIDVKLLRVFAAIVEAGGFAAAQAQLNVSPSRISTQIADLEARLGMRLCQRGRVGFRLT
ncbi:MAG TPA: LysR family transcriptional regulator, partial [Dongiaceae bacterium]|nr:LysR family transcriptional regulator [Dongiaceae bacterium]